MFARGEDLEKQNLENSILNAIWEEINWALFGQWELKMCVEKNLWYKLSKEKNVYHGLEVKKKLKEVKAELKNLFS